MRKLLMYSFLLPAICLCMAVGAKAQQADSLPRPQELWLGLEGAAWLRNLGEGSFVVPEVALKYRFAKHGALNLVSGYHVVKRDSLFTNVAYRNRGWYLNGGAEVLIPLTVNRAVHFTLGGELGYSRFTEEMNIRFGYQPDDFEAVLKPGPWSGYEVQGKAGNQAWTFGFRQGIWVHQERFAILSSSHISFLLNRPENSYMPVHYIPGTGTYTPQYYVILRNTNNQANSIMVKLRMTVYYRLF